jgi:predicted nucleotidyltransferase
MCLRRLLLRRHGDSLALEIHFAILRIMRKNLRSMRKSLIIDALFPDVRGRILAAMLARPEKHWYLSELAAFLHTRSSSLQREVDALSKAAILEQWKDGRRVYLKPDTRSPVFPDLKSLFDKTTGLIPVLQQALESFGEKLQLAFLYGSIARSQEEYESDVDLLVVGQIGLADLIPTLRTVERTLGRPVNPTVFSVDEFNRRAQSNDHFLNAVLKGSKQFVKGSKRELEAITGKG